MTSALTNLTVSLPFCAMPHSMLNILLQCVTVEWQMGLPEKKPLFSTIMWPISYVFVITYIHFYSNISHLVLLGGVPSRL
jgi:hypothetical protein